MTILTVSGVHADPKPLADCTLLVAHDANAQNAKRQETSSVVSPSAGPYALLPSDPSHEYRLCLWDRVVCLRQSPDKPS